MSNDVTATSPILNIINNPPAEQTYFLNNPIKSETPKLTVRESNPIKTSDMRRFVMERIEDETGMSGTGVIAEGVEFTNGQCCLMWMTTMHSIGLYPNIRQLIAIHGHNGRTVIRYIDDV
jgi:L-alanine-DL-glutamate epimerase-like enolase superfamily enzyme